MKICFVGLEIVPAFNETFVGGLVNNVVRLSRELTERGNEVHIVTSDIRNVLKGPKSFPWAEVFPVRLRGEYASAGSGLEFFLRIMSAIRKRDSEECFDVLHIHSAYPLLAPIGGISSLTKRIPVVFTLYSPIQTTCLRDRKGIYQRLSSLPISRFLFTNTNRVLAISQNIRMSLLRIGIKESRISTLPPVVDSSFFNGPLEGCDKRVELGIPKDAPVILYIGNWATWKGVDYLIESMTRVRDVFPDVRLITAWGEIYNWYDDRKEFLDRRIEELGLSEAVGQVGIVENLPSLINGCDVVAEPFLNTDGVADLPMAILESMACGKPVVSTEVEGIPEIVDHGVTGLLVNPGNSEELANALIRILQNKEESDAMGRSARDYAFSNYSSKTVVDKLETIYHDVLGG